MINFKTLDLNLLQTLDMLLAEHHVTRAAERLNLSQPSVSVQLARLRELFGDPLLLPGPRGMRPTARADELREPLRQALEALQRAVSPAGPFDPAQASHTWRLALSDLGASSIVLPLLASLRAAAPGTRLALKEMVPSRMASQCERGEIDLAFHITEEAPEGLRRRPLFTERYVLAGRADHPRLKRRPTLAQFCQLEHVMVSQEGEGFTAPTDRVLADAGLARRVVLSVPHFLFLHAALLHSDLVAMVPQRLLRPGDGLKMVEAPVEVPGYEMSMFWHERVHRDPAHQWLREQITAGVPPPNSAVPSAHGRSSARTRR